MNEVLERLMRALHPNPDIHAALCATPDANIGQYMKPAADRPDHGRPDHNIRRSAVG